MTADADRPLRASSPVLMARCGDDAAASATYRGRCIAQAADARPSPSLEAEVAAARGGAWIFSMTRCLIKVRECYRISAPP